jgi:hypothetical protein
MARRRVEPGLSADAAELKRRSSVLLKRNIVLTVLALTLAGGVIGAVCAAATARTRAAVVADVYLHGPRGSGDRG